MTQPEKRQRLARIVRYIFFTFLAVTVAFALYSLVKIFVIMN